MKRLGVMGYFVLTIAYAIAYWFVVLGGILAGPWTWAVGGILAPIVLVAIGYRLRHASILFWVSAMLLGAEWLVTIGMWVLGAGANGSWF